MFTVGKILREKRIEKNLSLEQVEKSTKIRTKFLELIENDDFSNFESQQTVRGFVRNYASFLGLSTNQIMAFYRRQSDDSTTYLLPKPGPVVAGFKITPKFITVVLTGIALSCFVGFLITQYLSFRGAPSLSVISPENNIVVSSSQIDIIGKTDPDSSLEINDQNVSTTQTGEFKVSIPLTPGLNKITIRATNRFKKTSEIIRQLRLEQ